MGAAAGCMETAGGVAGCTHLPPIFTTLLRTNRRKKSNRLALVSFREQLWKTSRKERAMAVRMQAWLQQ